jgi:DNA-binding helix-turn-helix protein
MLTEQQEIGELIREKRKQKYFTQGQLADKLQLTRDAILAYEKGKVKVIPFEKRVKLAAILDIPLFKLLYRSESDTSIPTTSTPQKISDKFYREKQYYAINQHFLIDYNIALLKTSNGYKFICNDTEEEFTIPSECVKFTAALLQNAKKEVSHAVFLSLKNSFSAMEKISAVMQPLESRSEIYLDNVTAIPFTPISGLSQDTTSQTDDTKK